MASKYQTIAEDLREQIKSGGLSNCGRRSNSATTTKHLATPFGTRSSS
jgi:hypothetical protein